MNLTDTETIKHLARKCGIRPSPNSGQHFLIDQNVLDAIVEYADIAGTDRVLEIGPGFGVLTEELVLRAGAVLAVEMDQRLVAHLSNKFRGNKKFHIEQNDILKVPNLELAEKLGGEGFRVISNIPYQITGKIVRKLVSDTTPKPVDALLLVQKEVGERICAKPGKMNLFALATQLYAKPSVVFIVPKDSFWPVPAVASALLHIAEIQPHPRYTIQNIKHFWQVARIGFSSPRKQLHNNLASGLGIAEASATAALAEIGLNKTVRAQELSVQEWVRLAELL